LVCVDGVFIYPRVRIQKKGVGLFPNITNDIVPFFKRISIGRQLIVLAPPLKYLNLVETLVEASH
jgi:hypothetical protein